MIRGKVDKWARTDKPCLVPVRFLPLSCSDYTVYLLVTESGGTKKRYREYATLWVQWPQHTLTCGYSGDMATKVRHIRVPDDIWEGASARAYVEHTSASAVAVEALREFWRSGARVAASGPPGAHQAPRSPVLPGPVLHADSGDAPCRHPSAAVEAGVCRECGTDVWLR